MQVIRVSVLLGLSVNWVRLLLSTTLRVNKPRPKSPAITKQPATGSGMEGFTCRVGTDTRPLGTPLRLGAL
ncbi:unnamed protein product [Arctogadus glacialis]